MAKETAEAAVDEILKKAEPPVAVSVAALDVTVA